MNVELAIEPASTMRHVCQVCCAKGTLHLIPELNGVGFLCTVHNVSLFIQDGEVTNMGTIGVAQ